MASLPQRLLRGADRLEEAFMIVALAFMTLLTFVQVVLRYGFGTGFVWSLEATTYAFAWLVLIGMSYGVRTQSAHRGRPRHEPLVAARRAHRRGRRARLRAHLLRADDLRQQRVSSTA